MLSIVYVRFLFFFCCFPSIVLFTEVQTKTALYQAASDLYPAFVSLILVFIHDFVFLCYNDHVYNYRKDAEAYNEIIETKQDT